MTLQATANRTSVRRWVRYCLPLLFLTLLLGGGLVNTGTADPQCSSMTTVCRLRLP